MSSEVVISEARGKFAGEASRPAHMDRTEALAKANKAMVQLKQEAVEWLAADMERLAALIRGLDPESENRGDVLQDIYQTVCSIRDTSGHFGKHSLSVLADGFCELVARMSDAGKCHVEAVQTHHNALKLVYRTGDTGLSQKGVSDLTENLRYLIDMYPLQAPPKKQG